MKNNISKNYINTPAQGENARSGVKTDENTRSRGTRPLRGKTPALGENTRSGGRRPLWGKTPAQGEDARSGGKHPLRGKTPALGEAACSRELVSYNIIYIIHIYATFQHQMLLANLHVEHHGFDT